MNLKQPSIRLTPTPLQTSLPAGRGEGLKTLIFKHFASKSSPLERMGEGFAV
jgi:hypothetical protein